MNLRYKIDLPSFLKNEKPSSKKTCNLLHILEQDGTYHQFNWPFASLTLHRVLTKRHSLDIL